MACMGFAGQQRLVRQGHLVQAWVRLIRRPVYQLSEGMRVLPCKGKNSTTAGLHYATEYPVRPRLKTKTSVTYSGRDGSRWRAWASLDNNTLFEKLTWSKHGRS